MCVCGTASHAWYTRRSVLSDSPSGAADSPIDWLTVQRFRRTLRRDDGHFVSARVGQGYPKSAWQTVQWWCQTIHQNWQCRFWVGLGTSQILIYIKMHTWMVTNKCLYGSDFWVVTVVVAGSGAGASFRLSDHSVVFVRPSGRCRSSFGCRSHRRQSLLSRRSSAVPPWPPVCELRCPGWSISATSVCAWVRRVCQGKSHRWQVTRRSMVPKPRSAQESCSLTRGANC
jgi:hypothetical protein